MSRAIWYAIGIAAVIILTFIASVGVSIFIDGINEIIEKNSEDKNE